MTTTLVTLACLFAFVTGINDGGAVLGTGLKVPSVRPLFGLLALMLAVAVVPMITSRVALTFTTRLTPLTGTLGRLAMIVAVVAALTVVIALSVRGRPTSLTLAIVGAVTGAGLGFGLPISPGAVAFVLVVGLAAPFAGAFVATVTSGLLVTLTTTRALPGWHRAGFAVQCLAYAANDGQKMLAVFMVALGFSGAPPEICALTAVLFGLGALYGLPRAGRTLIRELLASRPLHSVSAELASGATVIGCAAAGAPVSMTQAIAGGMIGAGVFESSRRVRWQAAMKIVIAWMVTLPVSGLLAGVAALVVKGVAA
ncbi:PiT family inorganic phosphate transporter [Thermocatellispora tengchongensis]|uniref:PiT family inorganic phosphate transporter n=1 Tax=Thermocatellispora tengchongensis TaxID=1073253 RepID=A0A840PBG2_9ACTN|nr:inorganic phosphate transporter [Thermocatellispora tengchongensis]MBB5136339.1 PiT family inorganic phosphate transporter [Thermocatellispora tengchongensis]